MSWPAANQPQGSIDSWGDFIPAQPAADGQFCWLNQFGILRISGPDAERFLQGQLTNNMSELTDGKASFGACCSAKGRMVANFIIINSQNSYWLVMPADSAELLAQHLQKYKVFFKAELENLSDSQLVFGSHSAQTTMVVEANDKGLTVQLSEQHGLLIASPEQAPAELATPLYWQQAQQEAGILFVSAEQSEQWIPQQLNWHQLGGVSFNKGCYTGQEIIARMQYLGKSKKALHLYKADQPATGQPESPTKLYDDNGKAIAEVLMQRADSTQQALILAVVSGEVAPQQLYSDENQQFSLTLQNLPYTVEETE